MQSIVGHCKCGAPIYSFEGAWGGLTPPPLYYSCVCNNWTVTTCGSGTTTYKMVNLEPATGKETHKIIVVFNDGESIVVHTKYSLKEIAQEVQQNFSNNGWLCLDDLILKYSDISAILPDRK